MKAFKFAPALLAAQALFSVVAARPALHAWETGPLQEYDELLSPPYPVSDSYTPIHQSGLPLSVVHPGLYHTAFYLPAEPDRRMIDECHKHSSIERSTDPRRYGRTGVRSAVVQYNPKTRYVEVRLITGDRPGFTQEGHALTGNSGSLVALRVVPPNCMFIKGDAYTYFEEVLRLGEVQHIEVNFTPELFAVFLPSKSVMPSYTVADGTLINETFVSGGPCRLITRVRVPRDALLVEASPTELRIKLKMSDGTFKLLRTHRWVECACAPRIMREIAYWTVQEEPDTLIVVQTGRTPGETDEQRCQVQQFPRGSVFSNRRGAGYQVRESSLVGP